MAGGLERPSRTAWRVTRHAQTSTLLEYLAFSFLVYPHERLLGWVLCLKGVSGHEIERTQDWFVVVGATSSKIRGEWISASISGISVVSIT